MTGWRQVDDRQSPMPDANPPTVVDPGTFIIGTAMTQPLGHRPQRICRNRP
jgi:hypothetical protein